MGASRSLEVAQCTEVNSSRRQRLKGPEATSPGGETIVEFKVEVAPNNPGTKCSDGESIDYDENGDELNKLTIPGGTASITAGGYGR